MRECRSSDQQGIAKIVSLYNSELKGTVNSADAVIKAGKQYNTFTQVPDGMDGIGQVHLQNKGGRLSEVTVISDIKNRDRHVKII